MGAGRLRIDGSLMWEYFGICPQPILKIVHDAFGIYGRVATATAAEEFSALAQHLQGAAKPCGHIPHPEECRNMC